MKKYIAPKLVIVAISNSNVITTSGLTPTTALSDISSAKNVSVTSLGLNS